LIVACWRLRPAGPLIHIFAFAAIASIPNQPSLLAGILWLQPAPWQTVLVIAACQLGAEMFFLRKYMLAQVFVTPLALASTLLVVPSSPAFLLRDRIVETVIGAAVGVAVVLAPAAGRRLHARQPSLW
jgi:hypothetical protein